MLKCFQLLADALDKILTLEQVLVPNFHKQIEAMLKSMSDSKVSHLSSLPSFTTSIRPCSHVRLKQRQPNAINVTQIVTGTHSNSFTSCTYCGPGALW